MRAVERFLKSNYYIAIIALLCFLGWYCKIEEYILAIYGVVLIFIFTTQKDPVAFVPIMFSCFFIINEWITVENIPWWIICFAVAIFISWIVYFIRFGFRLKKGKLWISLLAIALVAVISMKNISIAISPMLALLSLAGFVYLLFYLFFRSTMEADSFDYVAKALIASGLVIAFEVLSVLMNDIFASMQNGEEYRWRTFINLGWGIRNDAAIYMNMAIGMCFYFVAKGKRAFFPLLCFVFMAFIMILSKSRGGILSMMITIIPYIVAVFIFSPKKKKLTIYVSTIAFLSIVTFFIFSDGIIATVNRFITEGFDDNGREPLYQLALENFIAHPIFGGSIFPKIDDGMRMIVYHSSIFQTLGCFGLVGAATFLFHLWQSGITLLRGKSKITSLFLGIILINSHIHGLVDNVFYMVFFMIIYVTIFATYERRNELMIASDLTSVMQLASSTEENNEIDNILVGNNQ